MIAMMQNSHILQTTFWAEIKGRNGWEPEYLTWSDQNGLTIAAALVLIKKIPLLSTFTQSCMIYIPKGPVMDWADRESASKVLADLKELGKRKNAIFMKIDPDLEIGVGLPGSEVYSSEKVGIDIKQKLEQDGWQFSSEQIQFRNTVLLDLTLDEVDLLARMKQKTRYNIFLANRKGVTVRIGTPADYPILYRMYAQTAYRDGFAIRDEGYYQFVWNFLYQKEMAFPLLAEVDGSPVSAVILFIFARRAYYFYGMSTADHREKMPNHLLQWEAIKFSKNKGCLVYDFWGAPDSYYENDPLWGVYRFKEGFNGHVFAGLGAWDFVFEPLFFKVYSQFIPRLMELLRKLGRRRIAEEMT